MKLKTYIPRRSHILVERTLEETKTKGGLFVPTTAEERKAYFTGKIIHVGKGEYEETEGYKVGANVIVTAHAAAVELIFEDHEKPLYSINLHDVLGVYYDSI